jgi:hypothetical protein
MYDKTCLADDGTISSPNLTKNQFKYAEILSEITNIAVFISLRSAKFRVETPDGMKKMLNAIRKDEKNYDTLSAEEKEMYEDTHLYETHSSQRLGNQSSLLQQMLHEAHQDKEIQQIFNDCIADIKYNASREATRYIDGKNDVSLK